MRLLPFVAFIALAAVSGHICSINPRQRGTMDISHPGSSTCVRTKTPCGGQASADPVATLTVGKSFVWDFQQNLNHYSIGSTGRFEVSQSLLADPQSDADFHLLGYLADYPAYHQYTQTNFSVRVDSPLPNVTTHGVLRIKYISNKPTEPTFIQCVDVKVAAADEPTEPAIEPSVRLTAINGQPVEASDAAATVAPVGTRMSGTIVGIGAEGPTHVASMSPAAGNLTTIGDLPRPLAGGVLSAHYMIGLAAINRKTLDFFLIFGDNTANEVHAFDISQVVEDKLKVRYQASLSHVGFPISGMHFDSSNDQLIVVGFQPDNASWSLEVSTLNYRTGAASLVVKSAALEPFVDFVWSDFSAATRQLFVLVRHEDEPTSLPAKLVTFDLKAATATILDVPSTYTFSTFFIKPDSGGRTITFFTPGAVNPDTGNIDQPNWQVVTMDIKSGAFQVDADFPAEVNELTVYWGGGVAAFDGAAGDSYAYLFVPSKDQHNPPRTQTLAYDTKNGGTYYFEIEMPFTYNMVIIGPPA